MTNVDRSEKVSFFEAVAAASAKATWCALATVHHRSPRVRIVHPTWQGDVLWVATSPGSPKARHIATNAEVDVQFQVAPPDFVHVCVRGRAELCNDAATRRICWNAMDYDMSAFFPGGPEDPSFVAVRIVPQRVELSLMFGTQNKRVWRA
jgi:general stress protein 26